MVASVPELLRGEGLPHYDAITPEAVSAHIPTLMAELETELAALEQGLERSLAAGTTAASRAEIERYAKPGRNVAASLSLNF